jgi:hypothetical protein
VAPSPAPAPAPAPAPVSSLELVENVLAFVRNYSMTTPESRREATGPRRSPRLAAKAAAAAATPRRSSRLAEKAEAPKKAKAAAAPTRMYELRPRKLFA